ncbi:MAG TPA: TetR/AcrR family transcriptional regulator [Candidatus Cybelea sp.]|nr:TetR/AcrR family transcriptional regulator [Candidatus Cybelea sp.]
MRLLEKGGPGGVTMRRVAGAVGITPMAIYYHFPGREALLKAVTDQEFQKLLGFIEQRWAESAPDGRIVEVMVGYLDYAFARPRVFDYVFSRPRTDARRFPGDFRARRSPTLNRVADAVEEAMNAGRLKRDDVWEVALALWAHAHGYVALYRAGRFELSEDEFRALFRRSMEKLLNGLRA